MNGLLKRGMMSLLVGMTMIAPLISSVAHATDVTTAGIFGRVTLADSTPISGVSLYLGDSTTASAHTGTDGKYTISNLPVKSYAVRAALKGYVFTPASVAVTLPTKGKPTSPNAEANFTGAVQNNIVISGLIRTHAGVAVSGATVTLSGAASKTTTTSSLGVYRFDGLSLGRYTITPTATGYTFDPTQRNVNLPLPDADGGPNATADFYANSTAPPATSRVFGRIVNSEGKPVSGISLYLGTSSTAVATTDTDGKYIIAGLIKGSYDVSAGKKGFSFKPTLHTVNLPTSGKPTSPDAEANFTLAPVTEDATYSIFGTVTANGEPVSAAKIYLGDSTVSSATTGKAGTYLISKLPAGRVVVHIKKGDVAFTPNTVILSLPTAGQDASPNAEVDFKQDVPRTYAIRGKVTLKDAAVGGVGIYLGDSTVPSATTNQNGTYAIEELNAGNYVVKAKLSDATFTPASVAVTLPTKGATASPDGVANFVEQPVVAPTTYSVHGHVSNNDGMVSGVSIYVGDSTTAAAVTGTDGLYTITGLAAGTVIITPKKTGVAFDPVNKAVSFPTSGTASSPNAEVNFTAKPPANNTKYTIRGRITNSAGVALPAVDIRIADVIVATTGTDGRYAVESLDAGSYTVIPRKTNFTFAPVSVTTTLPTTTGGALPNAEINFTSNEATKTYSITGLIKTSDGVAAAGVSIYSGTGQNLSLAATTNSEGRYTIVGLVAGTYNVLPIFDGATFTPASASIVLPTTSGAGTPNATRDFIITKRK